MQESEARGSEVVRGIIRDATFKWNMWDMWNRAPMEGAPMSDRLTITATSRDAAPATLTLAPTMTLRKWLNTQSERSDPGRRPRTRRHR
jgi:hypothetical protein